MLLKAYFILRCFACSLFLFFSCGYSIRNIHRVMQLVCGSMHVNALKKHCHQFNLISLGIKSILTTVTQTTFLYVVVICIIKK